MLHLSARIVLAGSTHRSPGCQWMPGCEVETHSKQIATSWVSRRRSSVWGLCTLATTAITSTLPHKSSSVKVSRTTAATTVPATTTAMPSLPQRPPTWASYHLVLKTSPLSNFLAKDLRISFTFAYVFYLFILYCVPALIKSYLNTFFFFGNHYARQDTLDSQAWSLEPPGKRGCGSVIYNEKFTVVGSGWED